MKAKILQSRLILILLFSGASLTIRAQENIATDGYAHMFITYPITKSGNVFNVFLNRKPIGKLSNGGRIECRLVREGPVAITLIEGNKYMEPLTQANNSRTISIKKSRAYYFRVSGSGNLEYILNTQKGQKDFINAKEFISQPVSFIEAPGAALPALDTAGN